MGKITYPLQRACKFGIRAYQIAISPVLRPSCRFYPSCSEYCVEAIREQGLLRGSFLTLKRLLRCQPFHPGGFDPVPTDKSTLTTKQS